VGVINRRHQGLFKFFALYRVLYIGMAVDGYSGQVAQDLSSAVLLLPYVEELRVLLQEVDGGMACHKNRVVDNIEQEADIGFHAPDAEFKQGPFHFPHGVLDIGGMGRHLYQEGIKKW
jgi:hypothetical protein